MPKFYAYESKPGGYIQTSIGNEPQTLQVAPSAETLLHDLGYEFGEYIPRDVTKPLIIVGVLETKPYGRSKRELLDGIPKLSVDYCELNSNQQATLRDYLKHQVANLSGPDFETLSTFLDEESPLETISNRSHLSSAYAQSSATEASQLSTGKDIDLSSIPTALRELPQWLCWRSEVRNDKPTKVPVSPQYLDSVI